MHPCKLKALVNSVQQPWFWDFGNEVLYQLCREHPCHSEAHIAAAKIWLIGRSYAAAIERTRVTRPDLGNVYTTRVGPEIVRSEIDKKISNLKPLLELTPQTLPSIVETHKYVTDLFRRISGQNNRSLASKYLHFHLPALFFIYDSRAVQAMRNFSTITGRASKSSASGDNEYKKFAEKCLALREHIHAHYNVMLTPRQIDRLLLDERQ